MVFKTFQDDKLSALGMGAMRFPDVYKRQVMDLKNGRLDAVVIDSPTAARFIQKFGGLKGIEDKEAFATEEYAVAVKKGNTVLLAKINATIKRLKEKGDIDRFAEEVDSRLD